MLKPRVRTKLKVHPGEVLRLEFLEPAGISATALAKSIGVPANRISELVACRRSITADTAIRLSRYWGTSVEFWMNIQSTYDIVVAQETNDYSGIKGRAA
jgi:addiction module HigA family antidote